MSGTLSLTVGSSGAIPNTPQTIRDTLDATISTTLPGYTSNLPGTLVEDVLSTSTAAVAAIDQARVDTINTIGPYTANQYALNQLAAIYGVTQGAATNTSCYVTFSASSAANGAALPGYLIPAGFVVSDGVYQYTVQENAVTLTSGSTPPTYVVATVGGAWAVPANTITQIQTSVPASVTMSVTNAATGTPGQDAESVSSFRGRVLQAGTFTTQGTPSAIKAAIAQVEGVLARTISVSFSLGQLMVMVSGGDPYAIAGAIYQTVGNPAILTGSTLTVASASQANPASITTNISHGLSSGENVTISGAQGMTAINGTFVATVVNDTTFTIPVNTTSSTAYSGTASVSPNARNVVVNITDYPDTYAIPFVVPLQQTVAVSLLWGASVPNTVNAGAVQLSGQTAILNYINSIPAGAPINIFEMQAAFQNAIATLVPPAFLTRMVFTVTIDGVEVGPSAGTNAVYGDPQSYFYTTAQQIQITRG